MMLVPTALRIEVEKGVSVSGLLQVPDGASALYVFGHGAGAGMHHAFMADLAAALGTRGIGTLRYQFPFMEQGGKRPDRPVLAHATVRAAVREAATRVPHLPLYAGGKSFGGRMTSQAQALQPIEEVRGLVFVGFPLHNAGVPGTGRAAHLHQVSVPMLFLQGTRDKLADLSLITATVTQLGDRATLHVVDGADHAFHVLARSGRTDAQVVGELADTIAAWIGS